MNRLQKAELRLQKKGLWDDLMTHYYEYRNGLTAVNPDDAVGEVLLEEGINLTSNQFETLCGRIMSDSLGISKGCEDHVYDLYQEEKTLLNFA